MSETGHDPAEADAGTVNSRVGGTAGDGVAAGTWRTSTSLMRPAPRRMTRLITTPGVRSLARSPRLGAAIGPTSAKVGRRPGRSDDLRSTGLLGLRLYLVGLGVTGVRVHLLRVDPPV